MTEGGEEADDAHAGEGEDGDPLGGRVLQRALRERQSERHEAPG